MLAQPVKRGCGERKAGGVYIDIGLDPEGPPVEYFLVDPPKVVTENVRNDLGVKPVGVGLIEHDGITHVVDWVGATHYPNVADFVEEVKHFGLSRCCELAGNEYGLLTAKSTLILIHPKAWVNEFAELDMELYERGIEWHCPKDLPGHEWNLLKEEMCAGLWWHDLADVADDEGVARRTMPSFSYTGTETSGDNSRAYTPAVFAVFPIPQLVVVRDTDGGTHKKALEKAKAAGIPVFTVDA